MIQIETKDGKVFMPEDAEITIRVGKDGDEQVFTWDDVARIMLIDGGYGVSDGRFGGPDGMPIRGLVWEDTSDLRVEIPMPLEAAEALGEQLRSGKVQIARSMPSGLTVAARKPMWTPEQG